MFCPKCRTEYVEGISVCADCGVRLVPELLPKPASESREYVKFEEILFTFNAGDIAIIKSLLESEGIVYYFREEFSSYAHPLAQPARLMVRGDQAKEAKEILKSLNISYTISTKDAESNDDK